ncbi:FtsW/RodA/SpoVE family cell cycle protein [Bacillus chungangensis]|uniref:Cell division protein FtsW (Lipid II flippase) n=1 Tax=Bacillus chungangensis TaxID=587633 RepID=A0ABT9WWW7_9BACI|nr:FtsW/RodA/SpoVE family cell cycle protein [Bacillus chungangensis]MDQ0177790.1 cell division protein FtsW (lipid II flippase) [Bacillus chungangensis]
MNEKETFLNTIQSSIRSKEAKQFVSLELNYHIDETVKGLIEEGSTREEAEKQAIKQMGDPIKLGIKLNKLHRPKIDWSLLALFVVTIGIGFLPLMILPDAIPDGPIQYTGKIKIATGIFGTALMIAMMLFDYRHLKKYCYFFYGLGVMLLLAIILSHTQINGAIILILGGGIRITSIITLPLFLLAWAGFLQKKAMNLWVLAGLFLLPFVLLVAISDITGIMIFTSFMAVMFLWKMKTNRKIMITSITAVVLLAASSILFVLLVGLPYQKQRLIEFLRAEQEGSIYWQLKRMIEEAGWFGQYMTNRDFSIPYTHTGMITDMVFTTLTYGFGWLFSITLTIVLAAFSVRMAWMTKKIRDPYGQLLIIGGLTFYTVPFVYNVLMSIGFLPFLDFSLPFISYGIMPTLLHAFVIGIILSVYRRKDLVLSRSI